MYVFIILYILTVHINTEPLYEGKGIEGHDLALSLNVDLNPNLLLIRINVGKIASSK